MEHEFEHCIYCFVSSFAVSWITQPEEVIKYSTEGRKMQNLFTVIDFQVIAVDRYLT